MLPIAPTPSSPPPPLPTTPPATNPPVELRDMATLEAFVAFKGDVLAVGTEAEGYSLESSTSRLEVFEGIANTVALFVVPRGLPLLPLLLLLIVVVVVVVLGAATTLVEEALRGVEAGAVDFKFLSEFTGGDDNKVEIAQCVPA